MTPQSRSTITKPGGLPKNRSKRYCDTGNCANRAHVRAYRERKAAGLVGVVPAGAPRLSEHEKAVRSVQRAAILERRARESGEAARREREARELAEFRRMMLIREV